MPRLTFTAAALLAFTVGCGQASTPVAPAPGPDAPRSEAPHPAAPGSPTPGVAAGGGSYAFCALARARGAASLTSLRDSSAPGGLRKVLARLDELTAAAPVAIKADFTRLDRLEHALLGGGPPDPQQLAQLDSPATAASLQRIQGYLATQCGIRR